MEAMIDTLSSYKVSGKLVWFENLDKDRCFEPTDILIKQGVKYLL